MVPKNRNSSLLGVVIILISIRARRMVVVVIIREMILVVFIPMTMAIFSFTVSLTSYRRGFMRSRVILTIEVPLVVSRGPFGSCLVVRSIVMI